MNQALIDSADGRSASPATLAVIDLASICPSGDEQTHIDAMELLAIIVRESCGVEPGDTHEVECRLYGGFRDITGIPTERGRWVVQHAELLRGLRDGVRIVPRIIEAPSSAPDAILVGTYANKKQKMVDGMIAEDLREAVREGNHTSLLLVSDDEDFVPVLLGLSRKTSAAVRWVRQRPTGRNDHHFRRGVTFLMNERWS